MSVIAWDGKTLAADRRMTDQNGLIREVRKVFAYGDMLAGVTGRLETGLEILEWLTQDDPDPDDYPKRAADKDYSALVITVDNTKNGVVIREFEGSPTPIILQNKQFAWGQGRDFAIAALECGKTAREAVEIASRHCWSCGNGIDEYRFGDIANP